MAGDYPDIPYVQARSFGAARETTQVVVIHATDNTANAGGEASYAGVRTDQVSCHFFVDEQRIIQSVPLSAVAFGCLYHGNHSSVQFELCGVSNKLADATLRRAAPYVKRICDRYGIPVRKIGPAEVRSGVKGICGHADITIAWPEDNGTHTDPGPLFPWAKFISYVNGGGGDDMAGEGFSQPGYGDDLAWRMDAIEAGSDTVRGGTRKGEPMWIVKAVKDLAADVAAVRAGQSAPPAVDLDALAAKVAALLAPSIVPIVSGAVRTGIDGATISAHQG